MVYLIAPHGTVDIGDAGVRSTGDVNIAALRILNASNIQAMAVTGVPTVQAPNTGGLLQASNTAGAAVQEAATPKPTATERPSVIIVEVLGYGGSSSDDEDPRDGRKDTERRSQLNYDPNSTVRVLGHGPIDSEQTKSLTDEEKKLLSEGERRRL